MLINKAMCTFLLVHLYDLSGKNISMEGRHLVLTLLASIIHSLKRYYDIISANMITPKVKSINP